MDAREIIVPEGVLNACKEEGKHAAWHEQFLAIRGDKPVSEVPHYTFDAESGFKTVTETLGVLNLDGFGVERTDAALGAAGAILLYVQETLCQKLENIRTIRRYESNKSLLLDPATLRNLEIFRSAGGTHAVVRLLTPWTAR